MFKKNTTNVHDLMVEHLQDVEACLINFEGFMRAATTKETVEETLRPLMVGVCQSENAADIALRRMIDGLGGSYLASTREDIISIATRCDKVANKCESIAKTVVYQHIKLPEEFSYDIMKIIEITREQLDVLEEAVGMFFNKFAAMLANHEILDEIRKLESKVDVLEEGMKEKTFNMDISLSEKLQLNAVINELADLSDIIEDIADKIQIMLISRKA